MSEQWDGACPKCSSNDVVCADTRNMIAYWLCAECKHEFKTSYEETHTLMEASQ